MNTEPARPPECVIRQLEHYERAVARYLVEILATSDDLQERAFAKEVYVAASLAQFAIVKEGRHERVIH